MAQQDAESADAGADNDNEVEYAWVSQTPTTRIGGNVVGLIYAGELGDDVAQNDTSFGLILEDPTVEVGTLFVNDEKPPEGLTSDAVDEDEPRPTDYRVADPDDDSVTLANGALVTGEEGPNTYSEGEVFEEDQVLVWYNGMAGQRIGRTLDFNGRPWARWTDDEEPYLMKGLLQPAEGWTDASSSEKGTMAQNGQAPRVARAPILRNQTRIEYDEDGNFESAEFLDEPEDLEVLIDISRYNGGRSYEAHVFDAEAFEEEFGSTDVPLDEIDRNDYGQLDAESEIEMAYTSAADAILDDAEYRMHVYTGEGFPDEPANWTPQSQSEADSFGIGSDDGGAADTDEEGLTAQQRQFVDEVSEEIKGTGMTPDEAFEVGLDGLIDQHADGFDVVPDVADIREAVYAEVAHLSTEDLE